MAFPIDVNDTVLLMVDHQTGLFQMVRDIELQQLKTNAMALVKAARVFNIPIISTSSEPEGPNGPLMSEMQAVTEAKYYPRHGEVNAWDHPAFADAVRATGRKTLIVAGVLTSVCVTFPSLSALAEGFNVYGVLDASGDISHRASELAGQRLAHAGATVTTALCLCSEMLHTWQRPEGVGFADIIRSSVPNYAAVMESLAAAQSAKAAA